MDNHIRSFAIESTERFVCQSRTMQYASTLQRNISEFVRLHLPHPQWIFASAGRLNSCMLAHADATAHRHFWSQGFTRVLAAVAAVASCRMLGRASGHAAAGSATTRTSGFGHQQEENGSASSPWRYMSFKNLSR
jgi:hypothetical protein